MIRFGLHLTLRGGREAVVRLVVTAVAVALGVGLLLATLAAVHAVDTQNARYAWLNSGTPEATAPDVYVARDGGASTRDAAAAVRALREAGFSAQMEQAGRSLKGQLKQADRVGARATLILGGEGVAVKEMSSGNQRDTPDVKTALEALKELLA